MGRFRKVFAQYLRLLAYVRPYRGRLASGIIFSALFGASNAVLLLVVKRVWAGVFERAPGAEPLTMSVLLGLASLLPLAFLLRGVCDFAGVHQMNWVGLRVVMDLRVKLFEHLQKLSLDFYSTTPTGEIISRVSNDVGTLQQSISNVIEDIVRQPFTLLFVLGYLLKTDWRVTLSALVLFPLVLVPILVYGRKTRKAARRGQESQASFVGVLHESIAGFRVVKAFGMEQREAADFRELCRQFFRQRMRVIHSRALTSPLIELVAGAGGALVFIYAYQVGMQSSQLITIVLGLFMLYDPVKKIGRVHMQIQESMSGAERVFQVLDTPPTVVEIPEAKALPRLRNFIQFQNVGFHYGTEAGGNDGVVLENVDLEIPAGSLIAIVGASGAGKTTLFNLIPRFYDPTTGAVKIDGVDIRGGTFKSLRDQIGLVTQETFLFNDTVANNIGYGKAGAAREEIIEAAQRAHAHEFIMQMPQQYDTVTGESGMKLSGGQRQRLAIARAILKNPPILLLDEATSALDTESERAVQSALDGLMWGGRQKKSHTMLVIAHRLSTVQHADRIIVLDKGRIVEQGTHDELLAQGQVYRRLYEMQFSV
jgi:subfamily B ATP-binding cassette protein MsbA